MINHNEDRLNEIFHAVANATRRDMVHMMALKERTVSKHVKVL